MTRHQRAFQSGLAFRVRGRCYVRHSRHVIMAPYRCTGQAPAGIQVHASMVREENWAPVCAGETTFGGHVR